MLSLPSRGRLISIRVGMNRTEQKTEMEPRLLLRPLEPVPDNLVASFLRHSMPEVLNLWTTTPSQGLPKTIRKQGYLHYNS